MVKIDDYSRLSIDAHFSVGTTVGYNSANSLHIGAQTSASYQFGGFGLGLNAFASVEAGMLPGYGYYHELKPAVQSTYGLNLTTQFGPLSLSIGHRWNSYGYKSYMANQTGSVGIGFQWRWK